MYVYRTPQFDRKAKQHNLGTYIDRLCGELIAQSLDQVQAHFKWLHPYLKRKADHNYRLVGRIVLVSGEKRGEGAGVMVLCLLDIFKRGAKDYEHFLRDPKGFGQQYLEPLIVPGELANWVFTQQQQHQPYHPPRPLIQESPDLLPWLDSPGWRRETQGVLIYESEIWSRQLNQPELLTSAAVYRELVEAVQSVQPGEEATAWPGVWLYGKNNRYILFSRISGGDRSPSILFLLCLFSHYPSAAEVTAIGTQTRLYTQEGNFLFLPEGAGHDSLDLNSITALARRAYPNYLLAYEDWLTRENLTKANLALSTEEEALLHFVSTPGNHALPLFLNGQAGSGKSTLLFYLFADYCYRKFSNSTGGWLSGNPLFLTYNERLLEVAKDQVQKLLRFHHHFVSQSSGEHSLPNIRHFFKPFQKFLLHLLPSEYGEKFDLDRYISFHKFKELYRACPLAIAQRYSPERCWHVIRTFIKGYGLEEMTVEDYEFEVPRKERTVSLQEFRDIYNIWQNWYQKKAQEAAYWDDQDLIKQVLQLPLDLSKYTAIFCDESQDFTRIELQLILRLSIFSRYDLGYYPLENLPFVFAGDPFQTLNPTGFRWESFKAAFYSEVMIQLDPTRQLGLEMNFHELECNYRSYAPIVKFNNLIQCWRYLLFNHREMKPQRVWKQGECIPEKFILEENLAPITLKAYIQNTIIIIPCEAGEEVAYLQKDKVLSAVIEEWQEGETPKNVLSAIAAKGLEFKRVILYKFGEACPAKFWTLLDRDHLELGIELEYFFNKLYVASSRAIERLFVVDTTAGDRHLWSPLSSPQELQRFSARIKNFQQWENRLQFLQEGTDESAKYLQEDDLYSIALTFQNQGLDSQDPKLLRRAQKYYQTIGDLAQGRLCEAWALRFEQHYRTAGLEFLQLGETEAAWDCFWEGYCWWDLQQWYGSTGSDRHPLEHPLIDFMVTTETEESSTPNRESLHTLTQALQAYQNNDILSQNRFSPQWKTILKTYRQQIEAIAENTLEPAQWCTLGEILKALSEAGYPQMLASAGRCFYRAQAYQQAVECFTAAHHTEHPEYYLAQSTIVGLPAGLEYLQLASKFPGNSPEMIYHAWEKAGLPQTPEWLRYIAPILEARQLYDQAFRAYLSLEQSASLAPCFEKIAITATQRKLLPLWLKFLIRQELWTEGLGVFDKYSRELLADSGEKLQVLAMIIYELAHSALHPDRLSISDRQRYEHLIKAEFLSQPHWQTYLFMEQVGIALEKIGGLGVTLEFYQTFCEGNHPPVIQQLARTRWLATKKKQEDYYTTKGKMKRLITIQAELSQKSQQWKIPLDTIPAAPPTPLKTRPSPPQPQQKNPPPAAVISPSTTEVKIEGLPSDVTVNTISFGILWFPLKHLVIKVHPKMKQVLIADTLTGDRLRVDAIAATITFKTLVVKHSGSEPLTFSAVDGGYQGSLVFGDRPQCSLNVGEYKIVLHF